MNNTLYKMFLRLGGRPEYMACQIAQRMKEKQLSFDDLAAELNISPDQLGRLALCRPLDPIAAETSDPYVQAIAAAVPIDAATLIAWLRRTNDEHA